MFLGGRTRDCCEPGGVFLSVNTASSTWGLFVDLVSASSFVTSKAIASGTQFVMRVCRCQRIFSCLHQFVALWRGVCRHVQCASVGLAHAAAAAG